MMKRYGMFMLLLVVGHSILAQTSADVAVQLNAITQVSPPQVMLAWKPLKNTPNYSLFRKAKNDQAWGSAIATVSAPDSTYIDINVVADSAYEYMVRGNGTSIVAAGYIYAGINCPPIHHRGILELLVDSTFKDSCAAAIYDLMKDISGDGWQIIRHDIGRSVPDTIVYNMINSDFLKWPDVRSVMILGHIAVPYSGDLNPDGHANHLGAWPADVYYGNMTGSWTDNAVLDNSSSYAANKNVPNDGKFDQTPLPSVSELQVSRVDFNNMPAFHTTEVQMMNSYLQKDHSYKMDALSVIHRGLVNDSFGYFGGEAFAANGWRNFAPLVGRDSVSNQRFISTLNTSSYQWAYACGGGSFTNASGVGSTSDFVNNNVNAIFTMMFGSYFGDWNVQNNFLRAPLCSSVPALTSCWAGRPNWFFHHMALGENIGFGALITQNNVGLYTPYGLFTNWVHVALLGDLTLRTDYIKQASGLTVASIANHGATISWTSSPDPAVVGYYVYRSDTLFGNYKKLSGMIAGNSFGDSIGSSGLKYYMVRPVKLQQTPSGTYYNLGIGIVDSANVTFPSSVATISALTDVRVYPNPAKDDLNIMINSASHVSVQMEAMDEAGKTLISSSEMLQSGRNLFSMNIRKLPVGFYNLVIKSGTNSLTQKWIKSE